MIIRYSDSPSTLPDETNDPGNMERKLTKPLRKTEGPLMDDLLISLQRTCWGNIYHDLRDIEGVGVVISSNHTVVRKHLISSLCGSEPLGLSSSVTGQSDEARDTPRNIRDQHMGLKSSTP